jgi:hypothetical protein
MRRQIVKVGLVVILTAIFGIWAGVIPHRRGSLLYFPTRLDWAALDLQASFGRGTDPFVRTMFVASSDGTTVICRLLYTSDAPRSTIEYTRDTARMVVEQYAAIHELPWLQIKFQERVLLDSSNSSGKCQNNYGSE